MGEVGYLVSVTVLKLEVWYIFCHIIYVVVGKILDLRVWFFGIAVTYCQPYMKVIGGQEE